MRPHWQEVAKTPPASLMSARKAGRTSSQPARSGVRTQSAVALHMRVGSGADVILTLPNAEVATQTEEQLRSTLAMASMLFQRIAKEIASSGKS